MNLGAVKLKPSCIERYQGYCAGACMRFKCYKFYLIGWIAISLLPASAVAKNNDNYLLEQSLYLSCSDPRLNDKTIIFLSAKSLKTVDFGYVFELWLKEPSSMSLSELEVSIKEIPPSKFKALTQADSPRNYSIGSLGYKVEFDRIVIYKFTDGNKDFRKDYWSAVSSINRFDGGYRGGFCEQTNSDEFIAKYARWRAAVETRFSQLKSERLF